MLRYLLVLLAFALAFAAPKLHRSSSSVDVFNPMFWEDPAALTAPLIKHPQPRSPRSLTDLKALRHLERMRRWRPAHPKAGQGHTA